MQKESPHETFGLPAVALAKVERDTGIEPAPSAWEADILPLY